MALGTPANAGPQHVTQSDTFPIGSPGGVASGPRMISRATSRLVITYSSSARAMLSRQFSSGVTARFTIWSRASSMSGSSSSSAVSASSVLSTIVQLTGSSDRTGQRSRDEQKGMSFEIAQASSEQPKQM